MKLLSAIALIILFSGCSPSQKKEHSPPLTKDQATQLLKAEIHKDPRIISWDTVKIAVLAGADIHVKRDNGYNTILIASWAEKWDILKFLVEHGADVDSRDTFGNTVLMWAVRDPESTEFLLQKGADIHAKGYKDETALIRAAIAGRKSSVELLLDRGADINAKTTDGSTALMNAAGYYNMDIAKMLLEKGADPNVRAANGMTPLKLATKDDMKQLLRSYGAKE